MKAKLIKAIAMSGLTAFLVVGIGSNVAQAKEYRYKIGEPYGAHKYKDGSCDENHYQHGEWNKHHQKKECKAKKNKKRRHSYWGQFDNKSEAERSHAHMRAESTNG